MQLNLYKEKYIRTCTNKKFPVACGYSDETRGESFLTKRMKCFILQKNKKRSEKYADFNEIYYCYSYNSGS